MAKSGFSIATYDLVVQVAKRLFLHKIPFCHETATIGYVISVPDEHTTYMLGLIHNLSSKLSSAEQKGDDECQKTLEDLQMEEDAKELTW
jgi:hypothetical protein